MLALNQQGGTKWTLYDLLSALQLENIESVMSVTRRGQDLYANYFRGSSPAVEDLHRTLRTKTALLLPAAAAWRNATRRLSIRDWVKSQTKTIVLLNDERHLKASRETQPHSAQHSLSRIAGHQKSPRAHVSLS